jgi:hypothetical protein
MQLCMFEAYSLPRWFHGFCSHFFSFIKVQYPNLMAHRLSKYLMIYRTPFHPSPNTRLHLCYIPTYVWGQGDRVHSTKISLNSLAVNVESVDSWVVFCVVYFLCFHPNTVHSVPYTPRLYATFEASSP